jgi:hypothetical protein
MPLRSTRLASSAAVPVAVTIPAAFLTPTPVSAAALAADAAASITAAAWTCEEKAPSHALRRPRIQASIRNCSALRSRRRGGGFASKVPELRHADYAHRLAKDTPQACENRAFAHAHGAQLRVSHRASSRQRGADSVA